jgi:cellulose synthase/poly-beta-1,6-N-acetylglucosamine synthase-like glycosyltransferase
VQRLARDVRESSSDDEGGEIVAAQIRAQWAADRLKISHPELSAGEPLWAWQQRLLEAIGLALICSTAIAPREVAAGLFAVLAVPFFFVVVLRAIALQPLFSRTSSGSAGRPFPESEEGDELPVYSVLVPLFQEAEIVRDLIGAMAKIDYPPERLEVLLIVESSDRETQAAIANTPIASNTRIVVVPDGTPRTKPRALNFALATARGEYVVIYDAEDCPDPSQIRKALSLLKAGHGGIGCVQACLNIYNPSESWLTRQFAIEYTALFDCILPALQRLKLPVPLGGTSNHFPRRVLDAVGGWDPYNVTEDADLGIRLARSGLKVEVLASTTWEEAPATFAVWMKQRTRWLKGWMQTYLVHMREPTKLYAELGGFRFIGFQVLMGGLILSALVHPWFYVLTAFDLLAGSTADGTEGVITSALWWLGAVNLIFGYGTGIALGVAATLKRGWYGLAAYSILMPFYWVLISLAAYRAMVQLVTAPYLWEKTTHKARSPTLVQAKFE